MDIRHFISFATVLLYLLLAASCWLGSEPDRTRNYMVFGLLTLAGLAAAPYYNSADQSGLYQYFQVVPYTLANLAPVAAALLLFQLFEERDVSSLLYWAPALVAMGLDSFDYLVSQGGNWPQDQLLIVVFEYFPQLVKITYLLLAVFALLPSWRADLVHGRFRLRFVILITIGVIGLEMLVVENLLAIRYELPFRPQAFHTAWQFALALCLFFVYLQPRSIDWVVRQSKTSGIGSQTPESKGWIDWDRRKQDLDELLNSRQIFRDPELTVASLSSAMALPEYRLRQLINGELGYKNFKVFLNDHRIEAAAAELLNPDKAHLPILTIALDSGFRSIAPFNKAFKERKGMTPSEFRRHGQAGAEDLDRLTDRFTGKNSR